MAAFFLVLITPAVILVSFGIDFSGRDRMSLIFEAVFLLLVGMAAFTVVYLLNEIYRQSREREGVISIVSHQMRTPLTAMRWIAEMLLRGESGILTSAQREQVEMVHESSRRLVGLVNDLLTASRLESGKIAVTPTDTDLLETAKAAMKEAGPLAKEKKQILEMKLPDSLPPMRIDGKLILQAILNLLSNAIKYTPEGGRVTLAVERRGAGAAISVQDTGIGIPPGQREKVFEKFFRAENAVKSGNEGTGLGLYVVKQIVERSGGKLDFESEPGKGTRFFFTLPSA